MRQESSSNWRKQSVHAATPSILVILLLVIGACLLGGGIVRVGTMVKKALLYNQLPEKNQTHDRLLAVAKRKLRNAGVWHLDRFNADLEILELPVKESFGLIKANGIQVQTMERVYLPLLTDRKIPAYDVYLLGTSNPTEELHLLSPAKCSVEFLDMIDGNRSWIARPTDARSKDIVMKPTASSWRSATVIKSCQKLPPVFEPSPIYQIDVFANGLCTGSFAAWSGGAKSLVRAYSIDDSGNRVGKPDEIHTEPLDL